MSNPPVSLDQVRIASPCHVSWDEMSGDDRVRLCENCRLHVYNISAMTRAQADEFFAHRPGGGCVRFYRRADGTVLTRDCPVGLLRARRALHGWCAAAAAAIAAAVVSLWIFAESDDSPELAELEPMATIRTELLGAPRQIVPQGAYYIGYVP